MSGADAQLRGTPPTWLVSVDLRGGSLGATQLTLYDSNGTELDSASSSGDSSLSYTAAGTGTYYLGAAAGSQSGNLVGDASSGSADSQYAAAYSAAVRVPVTGAQACPGAASGRAAWPRAHASMRA